MLTIALEICTDRHIDTVVMNPPFGTRKKGADMEFLSVALKVTPFLYCNLSILINCKICYLRLVSTCYLSLECGFDRLLPEQFIPCTKPQQEM